MTTPAPLPSTIKGSKATPKLHEFTVNLIAAQGALLSRPACTLVNPANGAPRGLFEWRGEIFSLFGNDLYRGVSLTKVATLNSLSKISVAQGFTKCAIATGLANYYLDSNSNLHQITDPDLPVCSDVTRVDGRFVWTPVDGSPLKYSELNTPENINALSFFDAETSIDSNKLTVNVKNDLFVFGENSIERFRNVGSKSSPFMRVNNSIISVGYAGGIVETRDSFMFLGRDKDGGYQFYVFASGSAVPISNDAINEQLNTQYTLQELETCQGQRFNWRGVDCYVFSVGETDYLFSGGKPANWSYLSTQTNNFAELQPWGYRNAMLFKNEWYVQKNGGLYKLTAANIDTEGNFERGFQTFARVPSEQTFELNGLELSIAQSVDNSSVGLSLSKDGSLWTNRFYRETGNQYDNKLVWRPLGGLGQYEGYVGIQVYTSDNVPFATDNMVLM